MKNYLQQIIAGYLKSIDFEQLEIIEILKTKNPDFGDYTSNISLKLTKKLNQSPMDIAEKIKEYIIKEYKDSFDGITVTKPGFINMFLSKKLLVNKTLLFNDENFKPEFKYLEKLKINYEYVSANPTGDLHIGHARNAIVGEIIVKTLKFIGHDVYTEYYLNDGGNQINVLAESIYFYLAPKLNIEISLEKENVGYHGKEIISFAEKLYENGFEFTGKSEKEKINDLKEISTKHFLNEIKDLLLYLGLPEFDKWTSEKQLLEEEAQIVIDELKKLNAVYEKDGATWIAVGNYGDEKDRVLIKSDGSYTYMVADIANHVNKYKRGFDLIIDLWGKDHHGYEPRIQASMNAINMGGKMEVDYISMVQIMNGNEKMKMSKRAGTSLRIKDILSQMNKDVFKYFIVSKAKEQEMEIDINIATENNLSNPFYYTQYANARINQIIDKYNASSSVDINKYSLIKEYKLLGESKKEKELLIKMLEFEDVIVSVNNEREPSLIINYIKELAQVFNSYYASEKVISENKDLTNERIQLMISLRNEFKILFKLIGIEPINKL